MNWSFSKSALHCGAACIALVCANAAWAQAKPIDIPAEDAGKSIPELARQAGVQIIAPGQALHGVVTPAYKGDYEVRVALAGMLKGTDLAIASDDGQTIVLAQNQKNVSAAANDVAANTPNAPVEQVVVTGSRVISSIANSPTPLTVVTTQQLQSTTPSNIPDALNKLPVFSGSQQPRTAGNGGSGSGMNILNLRNFGAQRTLVLFDGHRVAPDTQNGTVDIDTIPQLLMSRVDVVTGGASAVYGSDAVTGVVNFVLDKHFTGLKFDVNTGISNYGDGFGYKLSAAAGADLFGGRGHFEMSLEHFSQDGVPIANRPYGPEVWTKAGAGTAASPYVNVENTRSSPFSNGGVISCSAPCSINGEQFIANGVVGPFTNGLATPTNLVQSGGDGSYDPYGEAITPFRTNTAFGRFSYNLTNDVTFYVQATGAESYATGVWYPTQIHPLTSGAVNTPNTFFTNNAFLSPSVQQQLNPTNIPNQTFQLGEYINEFGFGGTPGTINVNRYLSVQTGLDGSVFGGRFDWDVYYSHGESRQTISNYRNPNNANFYAAEDAVPGPNGSVQCYVSTTQYANLYPGCVPLNPFGPTAISQSAYNYISATTRYIMTNKLDDLSGSFSGTAFDDWAGPVKVALSAEMRWNGYDVNSNASPTATVNCTGLRLCSPAAPLWQQNTVASVDASDNVWEVAAEGDIPLLKDLPYIQSLDMNLAGRYTDYSVSGSVQTWKIGLDYHVNDDIRFRGTTSVDIRAPTLNDLFSPKQNSVTGFYDIYTNTNGSPFISSQGNPNLVPEVARTYTGGLVYTPTYIPGLTFSYDYYHINLKNAIGSISPSSQQVQTLCIGSGGTSPYCSLFVRPLPFGNSTPANYPTQIIQENLNTAYNAIEGSDIEVDYQFSPGDVIEGVPGSINLRNLINYQPVNESQLFPGAALTWTTMSKGHVTSFIDYTIDSWTIGLENRWISNYKQATQPTIIYAQPYINHQDYIDVNLAKDFSMEGGDFTAYLTVQNIFNSEAPLAPQTVGAPGIYYPVPMGANGGGGADVMGRYFTIGLRASL